MMPAISEKQAPARTPAVFQGKKVLIADDNIEFLEILASVLGDTGFDVTKVRNGSQAYEKIMQHEYDLVILDINMPKMNGVEAVRAIRERNQYVYIIVFSGEATGADKADALVYGADRFIAKPLGIKQLLEEIMKIDSLRHTSE
jgi:two-component system response regulator CpxR